MHSQVGFDCEDLSKVLAFVVTNTSCENPTIPNSWLKRRRYPFIQWVRGLDIIMPIQQNRRGAKRLFPASDHHRMSVCWNRTSFETDLGQHFH